MSWHAESSAHHLIEVQHKHEGRQLASARTHVCALSHKAAHDLIEVEREHQKHRRLKRPYDEHFRERAIWRHFVPVEEGVL